MTWCNCEEQKLASTSFNNVPLSHKTMKLSSHTISLIRSEKKHSLCFCLVYYLFISSWLVMISIPAVDITYCCYYFWKHGNDKDLMLTEPSSVSDEWTVPGDLALTRVLMRAFPGLFRAACIPSQLTETEAWSFIQSQIFHRSPTGWR